MTAGQTIPSYIELKNAGQKAWDSKTHLGTTQPRDRSSVFADGTWLAPNRPAGVTGTVAPGGTYKFQFDLHAPAAPGTYFEYFGVVEDGVAWFSDPGQGGPPDADLEVQIHVVAAEYRGDFKDQSFPLAPAPLTVHAGDAASGYIELTNTGTQPWKAGVTKLAPTPRDKASVLANPSWLSPTRVSTLAADVAPGAVGRFEVKLDASKVGDTTQTFGLVQEGVTWFADAPLGGGPADSFLAVHLVVVPEGASLDAGAPPGSPGPTPMTGGGLADAGHGGTGGAGATPPDGSLGAAGPSGCSATGTPGGGAAPAGVLLLGLLAAAATRRRRQRAA